MGLIKRFFNGEEEVYSTNRETDEYYNIKPEDAFDENFSDSCPF